MRNGLPLPKKIQDAPELYFGSLLYYDAFLELNTCRPSGWGIMPIPWTAIIAYADEHGLLGEQRESLLSIIRQVDQKWLEHLSKKEGKK